MLNRWSDAEAASWADLGALGEITYGSRLVGADPALVLHGGGNTSIKGESANAWGQPIPTLWVKGSGWDLATIEPPGFAPLRLEPVRRLAALEQLSDTEMVNQLRIHLLDAGAPNPSVEAILHALLPQRAVLHSHADAVLALTNTADGADRVRALWGDQVVVVPYVMPGFDLARRCALEWEAQSHGGTTAMVLLNHGVFTFGETTRDAYDSMIEFITEAERCLADAGATPPGAAPQQSTKGHTAHTRSVDVAEVAALRTAISAAAGTPMLLRAVHDSRADEFCARDDLASVAKRGPATPDHIIRTKQFPMVGRDVDGFVADYGAYFERHRARHSGLVILDSAPRVVLDPELGLRTAGRRADDCRVAEDIYLHTIEVICAAETLGGYVALSEADLFDVEYWELEQAKLARSGAPAALTGQVALVTGAASGIGRAAADALASQGAAVVGFDLAESPNNSSTAARHHVVGDVTDIGVLNDAVSTAVACFGGIDIVVVAAGVFGPAAPLGNLADDANLAAEWQQTFAINVNGAANTLAAAYRVLRHSPAGGRVVIVGSKNVPAPGPGAAAYSASKAALTQLARVAALEWAPDGITVNTVHPDGVFDTGLWSDELIAERAAAYGLTPEQYRRRNLLGRELASADVGALIAQLASPAFAHTTGAQIPQDGGSDRVV